MHSEGDEKSKVLDPVEQFQIMSKEGKKNRIFLRITQVILIIYLKDVSVFIIHQNDINHLFIGNSPSLREKEIIFSKMPTSPKTHKGV